MPIATRNGFSAISPQQVVRLNGRGLRFRRGEIVYRKHPKETFEEISVTPITDSRHDRRNHSFTHRVAAFPLPFRRRMSACAYTSHIGPWNNARARGDAMAENSNRTRDHLANERTFLAWVRTGIAVVVFGFAIGRFAIALRQLAQFQGHTLRTAGISVWMGTSSILAGVVMLVAGLVRYRRTRVQIDAGTFEPAGFVVDLIAILTVLFGVALAVYLIYTARSLS